MDLTKVAAASAVLVLTLVATDNAARRVIRQAERLDPEMADIPGRRFWIRGNPIHYVDQGGGFPIALVHGFGASTFSYRETIPALAKHFRVIAIDLPGLGYSGRDPAGDYSQTGLATTLVEFLGRLGIDRAVFVGHSMGGGVVQRIAVSHPGLVERLVLVGSTSAGEPRRMHFTRLTLPLIRLWQAAIALRPSLARPLVKRLFYDPEFVTEEVWRGYTRPGRLPGSASAVRKILRDARSDAPIDLSKIEAPALLVWGAADRIIKPESGERLQRSIPRSRLELVPRSGHMVLEEQPELTNRLILEFAGDLAAAAPDSGRPVRQRNGPRAAAT